MRKYSKPLVAALLFLLSVLRWILDQMGRAQTVKDLPIIAWILSPYFSPMAFTIAVIIGFWAYYDIRLKKEPAGFAAIPKNKRRYRIQAIAGAAIVLVLFIVIPLGYGYYHRYYAKSAFTNQGHPPPAQATPAPQSVPPPPNPSKSMDSQGKPTETKHTKLRGKTPTPTPTTSAPSVPPVGDATKTQVKALDPNDPNYEYLKRGCPPPQPGDALYMCNGANNDIHDNDIAGRTKFYNMTGNRIWNNRFGANADISTDDLKMATDFAEQYAKEHPNSEPDQQWVDWINARLKESGKQFQVYLGAAPKQ